jgi:hypothetical protein
MILLGVTVIGGGAFCVWHFVLRSPTAPANVARVADTPALPAQLPPAQQPVRPPADPVTRTPARAVEDPPPPPAPQPTSAPIPTGDDKIQVQALRVIPNEIRGTGDVAGEVQNSYDVALRDASVSVMLTPKEGPPITLKEVKVRYIPPRSRVPFSVPFEVDADVEDSTPANGWATGEKADEKTLCWLVSDDQCHVATPEKKRFYVLDGRVRNDSGGPVKDVIIYADFFIGHGIWKGAQGGTIDNETKTIGTNKTANFTLKFDTAAAKIVGPEAVQGQCVRVVAQKP